MGPTAEEREPPRLMTELRRSLDALCAGRDDVTLEHTFDAAGVFGIASRSGGAVYGWHTTLAPAAAGSPVWIWFDGIDDDLALTVGTTYWFEWLDLDDEAAVLTEVVGLCTGVLSGELWEWRTRRRRGCDVQLPDGRVLSATDGRRRGLPWGEDQRIRSRHQLPGYGRSSNQAR